MPQITAVHRYDLVLSRPEKMALEKLLGNLSKSDEKKHGQLNDDEYKLVCGIFNELDEIDSEETVG